MSTIQDPSGFGAANVVDANTPDFTSKKALAVVVANQEGVDPTHPQAARLTDGAVYYKATTPSDTQPISAAALPLPSGAATAVKQPALGTAGTPSADVITVQGNAGGTAIPVSAAALPLPSGAATESTLSSAQTDLSNIYTRQGDGNQKTQVTALPTLPTGSNTIGKVDQGQGGTSAWKVDGSAVTQPVSGTFWQATQPVSASALPLPSGAATETTLSAINTKIPSSPAVDHTAAGSPGSVRLTDGTTFYKATTPSDTQPISASALPLPSGASTAAKQPALGTAGTPSADVITVQGVASMTALKVDGSGVTQPISGSVTANIGTSGSLALDATLTGGTAKAVVRGGAKGGTAAVDVTSTSQGTDHQALDVQIYNGSTAINPTQIRALTSSDSVTAVQSTGTNLHAIIDTGSTTAVTQATAANLNATVVQATGTNLHAVIDTGSTTAVTQPTAANLNATVVQSTAANLNATVVQSTAANLNAAVVGTKTNNNAAPGATNVGALAALANASAPSWTEGNLVLLSALLNGALRTDNTTWLGSTAPTVAQKTMANSLPVVIASDQSNVPTKETRAATAAVTSVAGAASDTLILASNSNRLGATVFNDSTALLYLKFGSGSSSTSHTIQIAKNGYYEVPFNYTGALYGTWASATGSARVTEVTA